MKQRFGSGAITVLIVCAALATSLSATDVSAKSPGNAHHFTRVTALTTGSVEVRKLPAPPAGSYRPQLHPFHPVSALATSHRSATVPVATVADAAGRSTTTTASEQVLTGFTGVTLSQQVGALGNDQAVTPPDPQIAAGP